MTRKMLKSFEIVAADFDFNCKPLDFTGWIFGNGSED